MMKPTLPSVLLSSALLLPAIALLNSAGVRLPVDLPASTLVGIYAAIMLVAMMLADYSRRTRRLPLPNQQTLRSTSLLPVEAVVGTPLSFVSRPRCVPSEA